MQWVSRKCCFGFDLKFNVKLGCNIFFLQKYKIKETKENDEAQQTHNLRMDILSQRFVYVENPETFKLVCELYVHIFCFHCSFCILIFNWPFLARNNNGECCDIWQELFNILCKQNFCTKLQFLQKESRINFDTII